MIHAVTRTITLRLVVVCLFLLAPLAAAQTIAEVAQDNPELSTLVEALEAADLVETLSGEGPFTVFAPVDSAFEKLPQGQLEALLEDPDALSQILTYHVVPGQFATSDITADMTEFETVQGSALPITQIGVGQAAVTAVNIEASNGVIYLIDSVLTPPDFEMSEGGAATGGAATGGASSSVAGSGDGPYMSSATRTVRYAVDAQGDSGVSGSVLIAEYDAQTVVTLSLSGTPDGGTHPAELRMDDCSEEGEVVLPLGNVNGSTGLSTTVTEVSFDDITEGDHALNVYLSPDETESAVACGEVGAGADEMSPMSDGSGDMSGGDMTGGDMTGDEMTGGASSEEGLLETVFYEIYSNEGYDVEGTVQVVENAETGGARVVISLQNTSEGEIHPAHFHAGSCGDGGDIIVPLTSVDGESGSSVTDTDTSFDEVTSTDFYINIHLSPDEISTIVACGEVGEGAGDQ